MGQDFQRVLAMGICGLLYRANYSGVCGVPNVQGTQTSPTEIDATARTTKQSQLQESKEFQEAKIKQKISFFATQVKQTQNKELVSDKRHILLFPLNKNSIRSSGCLPHHQSY